MTAPRNARLSANRVGRRVEAYAKASDGRSDGRFGGRKPAKSKARRYHPEVAAPISGAIPSGVAAGRPGSSCAPMASGGRRPCRQAVASCGGVSALARRARPRGGSSGQRPKPERKGPSGPVQFRQAGFATRALRCGRGRRGGPGSPGCRSRPKRRPASCMSVGRGFPREMRALPGSAWRAGAPTPGGVAREPSIPALVRKPLSSLRVQGAQKASERRRDVLPPGHSAEV